MALEANGHDEMIQPEQYSYSRKYRWYAVGLLVIVGMAVGIAVGVTQPNTEQLLNSTSPAGAPTPLEEDGTPGPTSTAAAEIANVILANAVFQGTEFDDPESYQSKAMKWALTQSLPAAQYSNLSLEVQARQLYALACIYFSTFSRPNAWTDELFGVNVALPTWFSNDGWLVRAEVCQWFGITCDEQNRVSKLELDTNGLTGTFPPEVQLLKDSLTYLDLYNNLVHNKGDEGNSWLGQLTNLEYLYFGATSFEYNGVPTEIGQLTKLKELDFSYSLYMGPLREGMWGGMTDLSYLVMDGNAYNSALPQDLVSLSNLEFLYAGNSLVEGDLDFVAEMPKISELWIDDSPGLSGSLPAAIAGSETLASLSLTNCGLTGTLPTEFGLMTNMVQLWLYGNELSGTIPTELENLIALKILNLQVNNLTGTMPEGLCNRRSPIGRLSELEADCDGDVACADTCCTCCGEICIDPQS
jgi:hypothetical protein